MRPMLPAFAFVVVSGLAGAAAAQTLSVGGSVSGALATTDPAQSDGSRYDCYALTATTAQNVTVSMTATGFTPYIMVIPGTSCSAIARGSDTNEINVSLEPGPYRIIANSLEAGSMGAYRLSVTAIAGTIAGGDNGARKGKPIEGGNGTVEGVLSLIDRRSFNRAYFDCYAFQLPQGADLEVSMTSTEADTHLTLHRGDSCLATAYIADNDDMAEGVQNSRITRADLPAGAYSVSAGGYDEPARGSYRLTVRSR